MYRPDSTKKRIFSRNEEIKKRKDLRNHSTESESVLWNAIKNKQLDGIKFRRQHSIGPYIMDFYCPSLKLCIEIDGEIHDHYDDNIKDVIRTRNINRYGITILRYSNACIYNNLNGILQSIRNYKQNPLFMEGWHKDEFIEIPSANL